MEDITPFCWNRWLGDFFMAVDILSMLSTEVKRNRREMTIVHDYLVICLIKTIKFDYLTMDISW